MVCTVARNHILAYSHRQLSKIKVACAKGSGTHTHALTNGAPI